MFLGEDMKHMIKYERIKPKNASDILREDATYPFFKSPLHTISLHLYV